MTIKKYHLSDESKKIICDLYKAKNYNMNKLADLFNTNPVTISEIVKDIKVEMGIKKWQHVCPNKRDAEKVKLYMEIRDLYKTKQYSYSDLGKRFNLSRERIRQIVKDLRDEMGLDKHAPTRGYDFKSEACLKRKATIQQLHTEIRNYYLENKCQLAELASKFNRSKANVYNIIKDIYEKEGKKQIKALHEFVRQLYKTGKYSYKELAAKTGMSVPTMHNICRGICTDKLAKIRKAIKCVETGKVFKSVTDASLYYSISKEYMSAYLNNRSLHKGYKIKSVKGLHFEYVK